MTDRLAYVERFLRPDRLPTDPPGPVDPQLRLLQALITIAFLNHGRLELRDGKVHVSYNRGGA